MEFTRLGSTFGTALATSRQNARLRAEEKRIARRHCLRQRPAHKQAGRLSLLQRIDASIDPVIACAACVMLGWLIHKWL